jgi:hypothetical protein
MRPRLLFAVLPFVFLSLNCGSSTPRTLQSVSAAPAVADAMNFPNGQVQFVATGTYNKPPLTVTPQPVTAWQVSAAIATITQSGLATCVSGQSGTAKVQIAVAGDGPLMTVATLTCP